MQNKCVLCPRECQVDRASGKIGYCGCDDKIYVARAALHMWEEPCISGTSGSGTVFFSGCSLKCVFCQNYSIANCDKGKEITVERLSEIFIELQNKGANNINLVTAGHYIIQVAKAIKIAKNNGLNVPVVYNSSGYEKVESLKMLEGLVDIYLPDMKYFDDDLAYKYSNAKGYVDVAKSAIAEMYRQVGKNDFDENTGLLKSGVIVRHLVLPGNVNDSKKVIEYLYNEYGNNIYMSIMSQYTPMKHILESDKFPELKKKIDMDEYDKLIDFAIDIGVENAFIQEEDVAMESFVPDFNCEGV
ncbi:MAG: radical SAM protein [Lachnospiraceae bacterium]|nr:radical SAM protein [Lachnospiraceae bacterium]